MSTSRNRYVALLRGINVGGHHKVPMADLRALLDGMGFENVVTILNSGNVILDAAPTPLPELEDAIANKLQETFGFPVPVIIRTADQIQQLFADDPFHDVEVHKDIRLYVSFLRTEPKSTRELPWSSQDGSFRIISEAGGTILSILDLSVSKTPKAMKALEDSYGKDITTRNWKTVGRIIKKL